MLAKIVVHFQQLEWLHPLEGGVQELPDLHHFTCHVFAHYLGRNDVPLAVAVNNNGETLRPSGRSDPQIAVGHLTRLHYVLCHENDHNLG